MDVFNEVKALEFSISMNDFIKKRLSEIKHNDKREIGMVSRNTTYSKLLTNKIRINSYTTTIGRGESAFATPPGGFKMNDNTIYRYLIEAIHEYDDPYTAVYKAARRYCFPQKKYTNTRKKCSAFVHIHLATAVDLPISIKFYHLTKLSTCVEIAAVAHNMFMFLGIEADYVACGFNTDTDGDFHSFNIIYPFGRDKDAFIFDSTIKNKTYPPIFHVNERQKRNLLTHKYALFNGDNVDAANRMLLGKNSITECPSCSYVVLEDGWADTLMKYDDIRKKTRKLGLKREL